MSNPKQDEYEMLSLLLLMIGRIEHTQPDNYALRNDVILSALAQARTAGLEAGIRIDPEQPTWPCVFIELPTGQVSWHLPEHTRPWDGHTTSEKYDRAVAFAMQYPPVPSGGLHYPPGVRAMGTR